MSSDTTTIHEFKLNIITYILWSNLMNEFLLCNLPIFTCASKSLFIDLLFLTNT